MLPETGYMSLLKAAATDRPEYPLHRFNALAELTRDEVRDLQALGEPPVRCRRGETIRTEGQPADGIHLLYEGWVSSSVVLRSGKRLIQKLHLPGDMLGTPSMVLPAAADTLTAVTGATTSFVPNATLQELFARRPRIAAMLFMAAQLERLTLMDALASTGRASATESMARFLLDLHHRLGMLGAVEQDCFDLPATQEMVGDLLGLTPVHVNRTLRGMVKQGLIEMKGRKVRLVDLAALRSLSPLPVRKPLFEPSWLPAPSANGSKAV